MRAQPRRKTRFYFCPEGRGGAPKPTEFGVIAQHPFLGSCVASVWGGGGAELSVHGDFPELLQFPAAYKGLMVRHKEPNRNPHHPTDQILLLTWKMGENQS